jgi:hypothetical protein
LQKFRFQTLLTQRQESYNQALMFAHNNIKALKISPENPDCSLKKIHSDLQYVLVYVANI